MREAAELLGTSHVQVARSIRSLEEELGLSLISRVGRGSALNEQGRRLIGLAKEVLESESRLKRFKQNETEVDSKQIRIATFELFSTHWAPSVHEALGESRRVSWLECAPGEIERMLSDGNADLGITTLPVPSAGIEHLKVTSIAMGIYRSPRMRVDRSVSQPFEEIPFVVPIQKDYITPARSKELDGWPSQRYPRFVQYEVTLLESALSMVSKGQCVGYFPKFLVELYNRPRHQNERLVSLEKGPSHKSNQDVYLVKRKRDEEDVVSKKIARLLRMSL